VRHAASSSAEGGQLGEAPSPSYCVVIECDGVLMDVHNDGHRRAFNAAFEVRRPARRRPPYCCSRPAFLSSACRPAWLLLWMNPLALIVAFLSPPAGDRVHLRQLVAAHILGPAPHGR
jgi:hypothetical protein